MSSTIRSRFAPSPTGHLHIGNARTAIMNWLFARHSHGDFILRIEDTDRERSTEASETAILEDLRWLGLEWDEGPRIGGAHGPYRQSERLEIYSEHIKQLREVDKIYPCYCTPEELEVRRKGMLDRGESARYDGRCRQLTRKQQSQLVREGRKPAFRFRVEAKEVVFEDLIKGRIVFQSENVGDFIVARPDGMPMYNFACVVDDHLMEISHVIRGDDHVSNTPRQIFIYLAFEWTPPIFVHIPMILGKDRMRLSKRHGATSVSQYRESGYLPEALVNFLSLLSWSSDSGDEILSIDRLIREFSFQRVSKSAAIFDVEKLDWMNGMYIRQLDGNRFAEFVMQEIQEAGYPISSKEEALPIATLFHEKLERFNQIREKARILFQDDVVFEDAHAEDIIKMEESARVFEPFLKEMASLKIWDAEHFKMVMKSVQDETDIKGKNLWMPIRVALTGEVHGPDLPRVAEILGYEKCQRFVKKALEVSKNYKK